MKHKILRNALPLLCAALIAAAGLLVPQWLLERQKSRILAESGAVETSDLAALNYEQLRSEATRQHISDLSAWGSELSEDDISADPRREPLDTELDEFAAAESVDSFQQTLVEIMNAWGLEVNWETVYVTDYSDDYSFKIEAIRESTAENTDSDGVETEATADAADDYSWSTTSDLRFCVSEEDSSLSAWVLEDSTGSAQLVLDAVSGIPVYGYAELDVVGIDDSISQAAAEAIRDVFETVYSLSFSDVSLESSNSYGSHVMDSYGNLSENDDRKIDLEEWEMTTEDGYTLRVTLCSTYTNPSDDSGEDLLDEEHRVELRLTAEDRENGR